MPDDSLDPLDAVGLGFLQGLTEFLPVSSSGHLALLEYFLGLEEIPRFFDVMLHVGTLAAVLAYYGRQWWSHGWGSLGHGSQEPVADASLRTQAGWLVRLAAMLVLATLPVVGAVLAFPASKVGTDEPASPITWRNRIGNLRKESSSTPRTLLVFLTVTSLVLIAGSRAHGGRIDRQSMRFGHALLIGVAQACSAMCPGLSRSGMTISTGLLLRLRGDWAVHFGLLMSIPAILGALAKESAELDLAWLTMPNILSTVAGTLTSAVVGYLCITLLLRAVQRGRWWWFSIYLWLLVASTAVLLAR